MSSFPELVFWRTKSSCPLRLADLDGRALVSGERCRCLASLEWRPTPEAVVVVLRRNAGPLAPLRDSEGPRCGCERSSPPLIAILVTGLLEPCGSSTPNTDELSLVSVLVLVLISKLYRIIIGFWPMFGRRQRRLASVHIR